MDVLLPGSVLLFVSTFVWLISPGLAARVASHKEEAVAPADSRELKGTLFACVGLIVILIGLNGIIDFVLSRFFDAGRWLILEVDQTMPGLVKNIAFVLIGLFVMLGWRGIKSAAVALWNLPKPKEPGETGQE